MRASLLSPFIVYLIVCTATDYVAYIIGGYYSGSRWGGLLFYFRLPIPFYFNHCVIINMYYKTK